MERRGSAVAWAPTCRTLVHQKLDHAVCAAYGWSPDLTDDEIISKLLELNLARAALEAGSAQNSTVIKEA